MYKKILLLGNITIAISWLSCSQALCEKINNIPKDVQNQIARLQSGDSVQQGEAAFKLGRMGSKAYPAVPYLIKTLTNSTRIAWYSVNRYSSTKEKLSETSPAKEAAVALKSITSQDFGMDQGKWLDWWEKRCKETGNMDGMKLIEMKGEKGFKRKKKTKKQLEESLSLPTTIK